MSSTPIHLVPITRVVVSETRPTTTIIISIAAVLWIMVVHAEETLYALGNAHRVIMVAMATVTVTVAR
jgi:hypothetical protein